MAAPVRALPLVRLPQGPSPITPEQRYWQSFKHQLLLPSPTGYPVTHIHYGAAAGAGPDRDSAATDDALAVTTGTRVQLYSARTRTLLRTIARFSDVARSGCLRPDGRVIAAADDSGLLQVFDASSRAILRSWSVHRQPVWAFQFSPASPTTLLSASDDKTVRLWDLPSADPILTLHGHDDYVRCAAFMPATFSSSAQPLFLSGSYDATVRLWDARLPPPQATVMAFRHPAPVEAVLPMPTGTTVLVAAANTISVLDLVAARPRHHIANHQKTVTCLSLASAGRRLVAGALDGHVKVFETATWNVVYTRKYPSPVLALHVVGHPSSSSSSAGATASAAAQSSFSSRSDDPISPDRHLVVGMQSGLLSITTRLSAAAAKRDHDRDRTITALLTGDTNTLDRKQQKRKRTAATRRQLDLATTASPDVVIAHNQPRSHAEQQWHRLLRHSHHGAALAVVLNPAKPRDPLEVLSFLLALRHRSAMRDALQHCPEPLLHTVLVWLRAHIMDPAYVDVCVEAAVHLIDLYADLLPAHPALHDDFRSLHRRVKLEVERAQTACQIGGMLDTLLMPHAS